MFAMKKVLPIILLSLALSLGGVQLAYASTDLQAANGKGIGAIGTQSTTLTTQAVEWVMTIGEKKDMSVYTPLGAYSGETYTVNVHDFSRKAKSISVVFGSKSIKVPLKSKVSGKNGHNSYRGKVKVPRKFFGKKLEFKATFANGKTKTAKGPKVYFAKNAEVGMSYLEAYNTVWWESHDPTYIGSNDGIRFFRYQGNWKNGKLVVFDEGLNLDSYAKVSGGHIVAVSDTPY